MTRLVLINGAPGSGKSSLAQDLSERAPMALALDIDQLKHALGGWQIDPIASGRHARRLALALIDEQLGSGHDVYVGQYLARTEFIEDLEQACRRRSASFHEIVLDVDADRLRRRLDERTLSPSRPEHAINGRLVTAADVPQLIGSLSALRASRSAAIWIDANGDREDTLARIVATLG